MACNYTFTVNGIQLEGFSLPAVSGNDNLSNLIQSISTNPDQADALVKKIKEINKKQQSLTTSIKAIDKRAAFDKIAKNLARLGVTVNLASNEQMTKLFPIGTKAGVLNGDIYINLDIADVSSPMHELLHLVFGVMKADNYNTYETLMKKALKSKDFIRIKDHLPQEYSFMSDGDRNEEAFARLFEEILSEENVGLDTFEKEYDAINDILSKYISKTFGISGVVDVLDFLQSPFSSLTKQGSTLFMRTDNKIPYKQNKRLVKQQAFITNLISDLTSTDGLRDENGDIQKIIKECE